MTTPRSLPQQPSVRRHVLARDQPRLAVPDVTPSPGSVPFGSPPAAPHRGRSQGLCCSSVHQYRGSLRLLARHRRRLRLAAYTPAYPTPSGGPYETSRGNAWNFRAVPPAHTLMRPGTPSTSFAAVVPARSRLDFGRPVRLARLRPGALPQTLQTPPHGGRPVLRSSHQPRDANKPSSRRSVLPRPARHYPRLWLRTPLGVGPTGLSPASSMRRPAHTTSRSAALPRDGTQRLAASTAWGAPSHGQPPADHRAEVTGSHVPRKSPGQDRAASMPDTTWAAHRQPKARQTTRPGGIAASTVSSYGLGAAWRRAPYGSCSRRRASILRRAAQS